MLDVKTIYKKWRIQLANSKLESQEEKNQWNWNQVIRKYTNWNTKKKIRRKRWRKEKEKKEKRR